MYITFNDILINPTHVETISTCNNQTVVSLISGNKITIPFSLKTVVKRLQVANELISSIRANKKQWTEPSQTTETVPEQTTTLEPDPSLHNVFEEDLKSDAFAQINKK
jgi:uncharacterized protein YlzI (FlbEa/FlbD family)